MSCPSLSVVLVALLPVALAPSGAVGQQLNRSVVVHPSDSTLYQLTRVPVTVRTPAGEIVLLDDFDMKVHRFNDAGEHLGSFGRRGQGPGEFEMPLGLGLLGDTLWVSDHVQGRVTYFDATGVVLKTESIRVGKSSYQLMPSVPRFVLQDGSVLTRPLAFSSRLRGATGARQPILRSSRISDTADTIATLPLGDRVLWIPPGVTVPFQPFASGDLYAASGGGGHAVVVDRSIRNAPGSVEIQWLEVGDRPGVIQRIQFDPSRTRRGNG